LHTSNQLYPRELTPSAPYNYYALGSRRGLGLEDKV
jgi:hypothetical protein